MLRVALIIGAVIALGALAWAGSATGLESREQVVAWAESSGPLAPLLVMGAMIVAVVIGPIPTVPISIASGVLFGPLLGFVYAAVGATVGALIAFQLARGLARPLVARYLRGHIALCPECSDRLLFWVVLCSRLIPVVSFALVSYGAGLTAMTARAYVVATLIGMTPMTLVYVVVGVSFRFDPLWAARGGLVAVAIALALPWFVERFDPGGIKRFLPRHD